MNESRYLNEILGGVCRVYRNEEMGRYEVEFNNGDEMIISDSQCPRITDVVTRILAHI